jgi:hypothetical protein
MLLLMKHLIVPFTLGAVVITTSLALSLLQVRHCFSKFSLSANHIIQCGNYLWNKLNSFKTGDNCRNR